MGGVLGASSFGYLCVLRCVGVTLIGGVFDGDILMMSFLFFRFALVSIDLSMNEFVTYGGMQQGWL